LSSRHAVPRSSYSLARDRTLTPSQAKQGGFTPDIARHVIAGQKVRKGAFRVSSTLTEHGHSSGYHEALGTTDAVERTAERSMLPDGTTSRMPQATSGYWARHNTTTIQERHVAPTVEASNGARTDTARTILSVPGGGAAGHSGSGVGQTGQEAAHDALRDVYMGVLSDKATLSRQAIGVIAGATAIASMAPAEVARTAEGADNLKDKAGGDQWEANRNAAKIELNLHFEALPQDQKDHVLRHVHRHLARFDNPSDPSRRRIPERGRPTSPTRSTRSAPSDRIQGGSYVMPPVASPPPPVIAAMPPVSSSSSSSSSSSAVSRFTFSPNEIAMASTAPFRAGRRHSGSG
jgi:hypothetical protein